MQEGSNVFISWSGARSKAAAEALRKWLPIVLQSARPWMSEADIEKGSRGLEEVGKALEGMKVGIICLTPENLLEPWILYEAGALSKTLDAKTRVCTYLLGGLRKRDVKPPLALFQATEAERDETRKMVYAVNKALESTPVPENNLSELFEAMWPQLERQLATLPATEGTATPKRTLEDMVAEVLERSRAQAAMTDVLRRMVIVLEKMAATNPSSEPDAREEKARLIDKIKRQREGEPESQ